MTDCIFCKIINGEIDSKYIKTIGLKKDFSRKGDIVKCCGLKFGSAKV